MSAVWNSSCLGVRSIGAGSCVCSVIVTLVFHCFTFKRAVIIGNDFFFNSDKKNGDFSYEVECFKCNKCGLIIRTEIRMRSPSGMLITGSDIRSASEYFSR